LQSALCHLQLQSALCHLQCNLHSAICILQCSFGYTAPVFRTYTAVVLTEILVVVALWALGSVLG